MTARKQPALAPQAMPYADTAVHAAIEEFDMDDLVDSILEPVRLGGDSLLRGSGFCLDTGLDSPDFANHEPW